MFVRSLKFVIIFDYDSTYIYIHICIRVVYNTETWYIFGSLLSSILGPYHILFCSEATLLVDFSVWFCFRWRYSDQYRIVLLCFCILCSILSVAQGTIDEKKNLIGWHIIIIIIIIIINIIIIKQKYSLEAIW